MLSTLGKEIEKAGGQVAWARRNGIDRTTILTARNYSWPNALTGRSKPQDSNVAAFVRSVVARVWENDFEERDEERTVGKVVYEDITRSVSVFRRVNTDEG